MHRHYRRGALLVLVSPLLLCAVGARAQIVITTRVHGEPRTATISSVLEVEGVRHASLNGLAAQLGGAVGVEGARVKVDLAGGAAFLWINGTEVESAEDAFTLDYPIRSHDGEAWVAVSDIDRLLARAFRLTLEPAAVTPPARPEEPAAEALQDVQLMAPLEPPSPPASTPAPARTTSAGLAREDVIVIDPGHGGHDAGAIGAQGHLEKDLSLALAREVGRALKETTSFTIYLTRSEDQDLALADRVKIARELRGRLFVSIHAGSGYSPTARGCMVFHAGAAGQPGAKHGQVSGVVAAGVAERLGEAMQPAWGYHEPREAPLRLLQEVDMPAVLVEAGFLTNGDDAALLGSEAGVRRVARAIAEGIAQSVRDGAGG